MMTCRDCVEQFANLVDEELSVPVSPLLEQHLNSCSSCQAYLDSYRLTIRLCRGLPRPPLPERLTQGLERILREDQSEQRQSQEKAKAEA